MVFFSFEQVKTSRDIMLKDYNMFSIKSDQAKENSEGR